MELTKVKVRFYGVIKGIVPSPVAEFDLAEGTTVRELLRLMAATYGEGFARGVLVGGDRLAGYVQLAVNDELVENQQLDRRLSGTGEAPSEVTIMVVPGLLGG